MDYNKTEDAIFKRAMEIFKEGAVNFFGIEEKITSPANIELKNIDIKTNSMDYLFNTEDGNYLHFEFQSTNKNDDMARFMYYDAALYYRDRKNIKTVVVYSSDITESSDEIFCGSLNYKVKAFYMVNLDGDEKYSRIKSKINNEEELTIEDIVILTFIPLMKSKLSKADSTMNSLNLAKSIKNEKLRGDSITLLYALFDKFADSELKKKFREVFTMTDVGRMIYEDGVKDGVKEGIKEGIKEGEERGEKRGKALSVIKLLTKKFGTIPQGYNDKIMKLNDIVLDVMLTDILDYKSLDDIKKYFG
jgi:predicted transposase/invertase (TIGR01784 family)